MRSHGTIDGRYLVVSILDQAGHVRTWRGDELGITEVDCPGVVVGDECPVCGWTREPWRRGDDPALAPCELSEPGDEVSRLEGRVWDAYAPVRAALADDPIARVHAAYDVLGIGTDGALDGRRIEWPPVD